MVSTCQSLYDEREPPYMYVMARECYSGVYMSVLYDEREPPYMYVRYIPRYLSIH